MAKQSTVTKLTRKQKFKVREHSFCQECGRTRAYLRRFGLCRICFRKAALNGLIPGVRKVNK